MSFIKHTTFEICFPRINISYNYILYILIFQATVYIKQTFGRDVGLSHYIRDIIYICYILTDIEYKICIYVQETVETVFTQKLAFTYIRIKSAVQAGNSIHL